MDNNALFQPKRLRFSNNEIIVMLREILSQNPYEDPRRWVTVQDNLNKLSKKNFSLRTIKNHSNHLVLKWNQQDRKNRDK